MVKHNVRNEALGLVQDLFGAGTLTGLTDGQLLERFTGRRDVAAESAFAALVDRHGAAVLNVCLGVLRDRHDAEDAFQATFLVLARRAGSIRKPDSVASWLYGVALRVASDARTAAARRRAAERKASRASKASVAPADDAGSPDVAPVVREEVARLPDRYRVPVLLCGLDGLSPEQAAVRLGWPVGTVKSRLARGKARLHDRLARRGLPIAFEPGWVNLPTALARTAVRVAIRFVSEKSLPAGAAGGLTRGVLRAMFWNRLSAAALALFSLAAVGAGAGALLRDEPGAKPGASQAPPAADRRGGPGKPGEDDHQTIVTLRRRVDELERKLDALLKSRQGEDGRDAVGPRVDPDTVYRVRPRFDCLVENVRVKIGAVVKKGDPLAELYSAEVAAAKNDFLVKSVQSDHDQKLYSLRKELVKTGAISNQLWVDTQNDRDKSRLNLALARDRLSVVFRLGEDEIEAIKDEPGDRKARYTLRSPVVGTVIRLGVRSQDFADPKSVLMEIVTTKP